MTPENREKQQEAKKTKELKVEEVDDDDFEKKVKKSESAAEYVATSGHLQNATNNPMIDKEVIKNIIEFQNIDYGALLITYKLDDIDSKYRKMHIIINPNCIGVKYNFNEEVTMIFDQNGKLNEEVKLNEAYIPQVSLSIFVTYK